MRKHNIIFVLFLLFALSISVSAHPGRTDSNGGHYNRDTGEYHYHNGEYAGQNQDNDTYTYSYSEFVGPTNDYSYNSKYTDTITDKNANTDNQKNTFGEKVFIWLIMCIPLSLVTLCIVIPLISDITQKIIKSTRRKRNENVCINSNAQQKPQTTREKAIKDFYSTYSNSFKKSKKHRENSQDKTVHSNYKVTENDIFDRIRAEREEKFRIMQEHINTEENSEKKAGDEK